jgi:hypothetical protein
MIRFFLSFCLSILLGVLAYWLYPGGFFDTPLFSQNVREWLQFIGSVASGMGAGFLFFDSFTVE